MKALLSVSDKRGIVGFARALIELGYEIVSTGGTFKELSRAGLRVTDIYEVTKFPECFNGRVKTLNPYIHGGILYQRNHIYHKPEARSLGIKPIDLVCVNLYPFKGDYPRKVNGLRGIFGEHWHWGGPLVGVAQNF